MSLFDWFKRKQNVQDQLPALVPSVQTPAPVIEQVPTPAPVVPKYIMTNDGNITVNWNGKTHSIGKTHRNYDAIVAALLNGESNRLDMLLDVAVAIQKAIKGVTVNEYGEVFYGGEQVHNVVADKISEFIRAKQPYKPLVSFLANLMENPSERSRNELYQFLTHGGFPITHDGCFMAYKGIKDDWKDCHTGTFDNSIGSVNEMPREDVDPDSSVACSVGFHVGTRSYALGFAKGHTVLVKVNPRDAVSVPHDEKCQKLRVCRYEVVEVSDRLIQEPLYPAVQATVEEDEDDYEPEGEMADDCGLGNCLDSLLGDDDDADPMPAYDNEDFYDEPLEENCDANPVAVKAPKRAACAYCGAKGGKKHDKKCKRPKR